MSDGLDRRTVLRRAGTVAAGAGLGSLLPGSAGARERGGGDGAGTRARSAAAGDRPLEVTVFVTADLHEYSRYDRDDGYYAARVAKTFLEGAFEHTDAFDVDVTVAEATPDLPRDAGEGVRSRLDGACVCGAGDCEWRTALHWFRDWYWKGWNDRRGRPTPEHCGEYHERSVDANLLIARGDGGGVSSGNAGRVCVAGTGDDLLNVENRYRDFGYEADRFRALRATIHEVGHCLMDGTGVEDGDGDDDPWGPEHDMSSIEYDGDADDYAITPMGLHGDRNNEGTNDYPKAYADDDSVWSFLPGVEGRDGKPDGFAYFYSDATVEHFYRKEPYDIPWAAGTGEGCAPAEYAGSLSGSDDAATFTRAVGDCGLRVSLSGPGDADFDLYVTYDGRPPTIDDFDARSWNYGSEESVDVDPSVGADELGILVHSYRGGGSFTVTVAPF